jgi:hypothetical protein
MDANQPKGLGGLRRQSGYVHIQQVIVAIELEHDGLGPVARGRDHHEPPPLAGAARSPNQLQPRPRCLQPLREPRPYGFGQGFGVERLGRPWIGYLEQDPAVH